MLFTVIGIFLLGIFGLAGIVGAYECFRKKKVGAKDLQGFAFCVIMIVIAIYFLQTPNE